MTWTRFNAAEPQPDLLQPVDGRRGDVVGSDRDQRLRTPHICPLGGGACNDDQGSNPVVGPDGTIYVSFANGNVPGNGIEQVLNVTCPASADCSNQASWTGPDEGRRHDLDPAGRPAEPERLPEPAVPTAERLPRSRRDDRDQLGRPERERVRDVGGSPQQHEPELRAGRGRRRITRRATTTSSTRSPPTAARRGATRGTSRRARASERPRSGSRGARSRRTDRGSGSRSTTATTATARPRAATTSPRPRSRTRRRTTRTSATPG